MKIDTDIDIDFADRDAALLGIKGIPASVYDDRDGFSLHPSGVYFQNIPVNPVNGAATLPYDLAPDFGYLKIDFLNNTVYSGVRDEAHLLELMEREPDWEMLEHQSLVAMLSHIYGHFGTIQRIKPKSIHDLAIVLALIRPGRKHLLGQPRDVIEREIWVRDGDGFVFKKSHAIAYAVSIAVQMNLICQQMEEEMEEEAEGDLLGPLIS